MKLVLILFILLFVIICIIIFYWITRPITNLEYAKKTDAYTMPFIMQNLLAHKECTDIISLCTNKLINSETVDGLIPSIRNSKQCWISKYNPLIRHIFENLSQTFKLPMENAEDMQVVCYQKGQYYHEHHDSCCDYNKKCETFVNRGGQRILTVLIYLNNDFENGETYFRNLNLKLKPAVGSAIVFFPLGNGTDKCHPYALHAGLPVSKGTKWVANIWFRRNRFT